MPELPEPDAGAAAAASLAPAQAQPAAPAPKVKVKTKSDDARAPAVKRAVTCKLGEGAAASSVPPAKKQKTEIPIVGIVFAMLCWTGEDCFYSYARALARGLLAIEDMYVVVAAGDRHRWTPDLKTEWRNHFYGEAPHTVYRVPKDGKLWVPNHVYRSPRIALKLSRERKNGLVSITAVEQAGAILEHMLNKKWIPKCAVSEDNAKEILALKEKSAELAAKAKVVALAAEYAHLEELYLTLSRFTENIDRHNLSNQEICRGGIEKGETPLDTVFRESNEEMDIKIWDSGEHITQCGHITFQNRKGDLKRTAIFASFTSHPFNGPENGDCWPDHNADRDQKYGNWFCAHSWYKYCPFLDTDAMDKVKAFRETRNIREVPLEEAMQILGEPSQNALRAIDAHFRKVFRSVEDPEEAEPAAAKEPAAAAEKPVIEQDLPPPGSDALKPYKITNNVPALKRYLEEAKAGGDAGAIKAYTEMLAIAVDQKNSWMQRNLAEAARNPNRLGATIFE